jgi:hypothetical protein
MTERVAIASDGKRDLPSALWDAGYFTKKLPEHHEAAP